MFVSVGSVWDSFFVVWERTLITTMTLIIYSKVKEEFRLTKQNKQVSKLFINTSRTLMPVTTKSQLFWDGGVVEFEFTLLGINLIITS